MLVCVREKEGQEHKISYLSSIATPHVETWVYENGKCACVKSTWSYDLPHKAQSRAIAEGNPIKW